MKKSTVILLAVVVVIALSVGACAPGNRRGYGYGSYGSPMDGWVQRPAPPGGGGPYGSGYCGGYGYRGGDNY